MFIVYFRFRGKKKIFFWILGLFLDVLVLLESVHVCVVASSSRSAFAHALVELNWTGWGGKGGGSCLSRFKVYISRLSKHKYTSYLEWTGWDGKAAKAVFQGPRVYFEAYEAQTCGFFLCGGVGCDRRCRLSLADVCATLSCVVLWGRSWSVFCIFKYFPVSHRGAGRTYSTSDSR